MSDGLTDAGRQAMLETPRHYLEPDKAQLCAIKPYVIGSSSCLRCPNCISYSLTSVNGIDYEPPKGWIRCLNHKNSISNGKI